MSIQAMTPRGHVELPTMPRTSHHFAAKLTIRQRPPGMRANTIHRVELAVRMK